eukprot:13218599-Heterocapsa_arctica.AAC.1
MAARRPSSCTPAGFIAFSCRVKELAWSSICCVGMSAASLASFAACSAASFTLMAAMAAAVVAAVGGEEVAGGVGEAARIAGVATTAFAAGVVGGFFGPSFVMS